MRKQTHIFTIYGEIEAMVAMEMGFKRIQFWELPETQKFNKFGQQARFAVIIPNAMLGEYESRVAKLRA